MCGPGEVECVLTISFKTDALNSLSEQLVQAVLSGLLSEVEARRVAEALLNTDLDKFLNIEMGDLLK
jgi:hypothetical protein